MRNFLPQVWILFSGYFHNAVFMALADVSRKEMCQLEKVYFNTFPTITTVNKTLFLAGCTHSTHFFPIELMVGKLLVGIDRCKVHF